MLEAEDCIAVAGSQIILGLDAGVFIGLHVEVLGVSLCSLVTHGKLVDIESALVGFGTVVEEVGLDSTLKLELLGCELVEEAVGLGTCLSLLERRGLSTCLVVPA